MNRIDKIKNESLEDIKNSPEYLVAEKDILDQEYEIALKLGLKKQAKKIQKAIDKVLDKMFKLEEE